MGKVFVTSDPHFCHQMEFIWGPRGFKNQYEMNEAIIENWNSVVDMEDDVYCLGDIMLNDNDLGIKCLKSLKGKIHIIRGNHCTNARVELYKQCHNVVDINEGQFLQYKKYHFYLSHYPCLTANHDDDKPLKTRIISLCGHVHTQDPFYDWDKGLIFHVEMDTNNCTPWNLDDIIEKIIAKESNK